MKIYFSPLFFACLMLNAMDQPEPNLQDKIKNLKAEVAQMRANHEKETKAFKSRLAPKSTNELDTQERGQLQLEENEFTNALLEEKKQVIEEIESTIALLESYPTDLQELVEEERPMIAHIEKHVTSPALGSKGILELRKADGYKKKNEHCLLQ